MLGDINSQIRDDMASGERISTIERNGESELEQKLLTPGSRDNDIKTDAVVVDGINSMAYFLFLHSSSD